MKDPGAQIQTAFANALGSLTYNGASVPVYTDEPLEITPDYFVKVGDINVSPRDQNNQKFTTTAAVTLDIVTVQTGTYSSTPADMICNDVVNAIMPTPGGCTLTSTDFQFISAWADSIGYLNGTQGDRKVVRKLLTITLKIEQI